MAAPTLTIEPTITGDFYVGGTVTVTAGSWSAATPDGGYRIRLFSTFGTPNELIDTGFQSGSSVTVVIPAGVLGAELLANAYAMDGGETGFAMSAYSPAIGPAPEPEPEPSGPVPLAVADLDRYAGASARRGKLPSVRSQRAPRRGSRR